MQIDLFFLWGWMNCYLCWVSHINVKWGVLDGHDDHPWVSWCSGSHKRCTWWIWWGSCPVCGCWGKWLFAILLDSIFSCYKSQACTLYSWKWMLAFKGKLLIIKIILILCVVTCHDQFPKISSEYIGAINNNLQSFEIVSCTSFIEWWWCKNRTLKIL